MMPVQPCRPVTVLAFAGDRSGPFVARIFVDIRKFFDTLDHAPLRALLRQRIRDGVLLRLIDKWLKAGVSEGGQLTYPSEGTPQGGVISPLLANIYLHYVLDVWFVREVKPRLQGRAFLIRYADDFVIGFACEADARRVLDVLPKRFGRYGLTLHPEKTRLAAFRPPSPSLDAGSRSGSSPGTSTCWGSRTTGSGRGAGRGWSSGARRRADSGGRYG
jgi:RNA-directed DNA polymerase